MATIAPYIPESITVHLGSPDSNAENVTVSFSDYVKNVLSSEVYPTWEPAALRANALAIISFALNRIYTEYYRSRGYSFDITSSTAIDQKFINGRNIYENISELVDELFTDYLRKQGFVEPLAAKFCNGVTVTCSGLSQWGSQYLAQDGANSIDILRTYYGEDVEFVTNAPVQNLQESYPGSPVRRGDIGVNVSFLQVALNRISQNYPAIPKVPVDAIFGEATENAVRAFQSIFSLTVDSIVGRATWYTIVMLYTAVLKLGELQSLGQTFYGYSWEYPEQILPGEQGAKVTHLQYMLSVVSQFNSAVQEPPVSGVFGDTTTQAVTTFQRAYGLPETGTVDRATWDSIYSQFAGIETTVFGNEALFPFTRPPMAVTEADLQEQLIAAAAAIKKQLSENFNSVIKFFSRISCKVKIGSRQERGIIGLPPEIFSSFDEGNIPTSRESILDKTENMLNIFFKNIFTDVHGVYYKRTYKENRINYKLMIYKYIAGMERELPFSLESTGTQSLLELLPFMLVVLKGSVAIIDEFDTALHDILVESLVISLNENPNGQLILTTHNTLLMESDIPKESIYTIYETENGSKKIECITQRPDNKIQKNTNIRKQYLAGGYRGIPKKIHIDFNQLLKTLKKDSMG